MWLLAGILDCEFTPTGYTAVRTYLLVGKGRDVALLICSDFKFPVLPRPAKTVPVCCNIYLHKYAIVIRNLYLPPGSNLETIYNLNFMYMHDFIASRFIQMDGFKAPGIHWPSLSGETREIYICKDIGFRVYFGLTEIVNGATRLNSFLDLIYLSSTLSDKGFNVSINDGLSDHQAVLDSLACEVSKQEFFYLRFKILNGRKTFRFRCFSR